MKTKGLGKRIHWGKTVTLASIVCGFLLPGVVPAADFPSQPIQILVGFSPGGPTDLACRIMGEQISKEIGVPIVVVNKPGAGGTIAATLLTKAKPDGYTLFAGSNGNLAANFALLPDVPYRLSDFTPIVRHMVFPLVYAVKTDSPWKTFKDFVEDCQKNPGKFKYGSDGGTTSLIAAATMGEAGIKVNHMVAKGAAPNLKSLLGGEIDLSAMALTPLLPQLEAGKVRILASSTRWSKLPNIPTTKELGYSDDTSREFWNGIVAPAKIAPAVQEKLVQAFKSVLANPAVKAKMEKIGVAPISEGPKDFGALMQKEHEIYMRISKKYKIYE